MTELFTVEEMCTCLAPNTSNNLGKNAATNTKSNGEVWLLIGCSLVENSTTIVESSPVQKRTENVEKDLKPESAGRPNGQAADSVTTGQLTGVFKCCLNTN